MGEDNNKKGSACDPYDLLRDRLRDYLEYKNVSMSCLSREAGASAFFVSNFLRKRSRRPGRDNLENLAHAMKVPLPVLLDRDPQTPMPWRISVKNRPLFEQATAIKSKFVDDLFAELTGKLAEVYQEGGVELDIPALVKLSLAEFRAVLAIGSDIQSARANIDFIVEQKRQGLAQHFVGR